jgi:FtsP/CotA-like multicopper oxidase with cupredoxin domain
MDLERIDATVRAGSVEKWEVSASGQVHNFHVHDVQFQVLSYRGDSPPPELRGWKDTIYIGGGEATLIMRFGDHSDPDTPYMFHCHLLRHEDEGMMAQFVVTDDGAEIDRIDTEGHDHHASH